MHYKRAPHPATPLTCHPSLETSATLSNFAPLLCPASSRRSPSPEFSFIVVDPLFRTIVASPTLAPTPHELLAIGTPSPTRTQISLSPSLITGLAPSTPSRCTGTIVIPSLPLFCFRA
ncbi:hypothetical protein GUJ93_ZPchr0003g16813 [Zizania palustris]|uniref:Uncharacterized protein n=1 Tax=Zizania palustris TaxID=103762 RepID=A0A8J5SKG9_ZIZPA|nr:hypothetical protein GUJ93_ZPchr0003g16813 [Zizania palustris]